ncbi:MAG: S-ribosylhomocysteine lyase [Atopobiaceae bacterium]|nr:S-ribosylhomocysteine lyase [Atopobiaceae bacterium]
MEKIASFQMNHLILEPGVYVSRIDRDPATGCTVTTFDLRMTRPNREPVMGTGTIHTIEHLLATYMRNDEAWRDRVVYAGPMGCRTGFYLVVFGEVSSEEVLGVVRDAFRFIASYQGEIPGAKPAECGNWSDQDLDGAHREAQRYLERALEDPRPDQLVYQV